MVGIDKCADAVSRAHIAGVPGMDIGHLHYSHSLKSRMVALSLDPFEGRLLYIIGEDFSRCTFAL